MSRANPASPKLDKPAITTAKDGHFAKLHLTVPRSEIQKVMGPGQEEVNAAIAAQGIKPAGPWFTPRAA